MENSTITPNERDLEMINDTEHTQLLSGENHPKRKNNFFNKADNRNDYDFNTPLLSKENLFFNDKELYETNDRDELFDERIENDYIFRKFYNKKNFTLKKEEKDLLNFCNGINVKGFLKEEFKNNPININQDDNGNVLVEVPNDVENLGKTNPNTYKWKWEDKNENQEE